MAKGSSESRFLKKRLKKFIAYDFDIMELNKGWEQSARISFFMISIWNITSCLAFFARAIFAASRYLHRLIFGFQSD
jgi:hypothetical protein